MFLFSYSTCPSERQHGVQLSTEGLQSTVILYVPLGFHTGHMGELYGLCVGLTIPTFSSSCIILDISSCPPRESILFSISDPAWIGQVNRLMFCMAS